MADADITIGELSRTIVAMEARMSSQFSEVNRRLDSLQFVHQETYHVQMGAVIDRVEAMEERWRWTARTLVAAFLFPVVVGVIVAVAVAR